MNDSFLLEQSLAQLAIQLPPAVLSDLLRLRDELLRWNSRVNLTAINDPVEVLEKHFVDSLTILKEVGSAKRLLDLGSGGGFPGLPLCLALPGLQVLSVDAVQKKIAFQSHIVRLFSLQGFTPWHGRAEAVPGRPEFGGGYDLVVARAFSSLAQYVRLALPCLAPDGRLIAMKGPEGEAELVAALPALNSLGVACVECRKLTLPGSGARRTILTLVQS